MTFCCVGFFKYFLQFPSWEREYGVIMERRGKKITPVLVSCPLLLAHNILFLPILLYPLISANLVERIEHSVLHLAAF